MKRERKRRIERRKEKEEKKRKGRGRRRERAAKADESQGLYKMTHFYIHSVIIAIAAVCAIVYW